MQHPHADKMEQYARDAKLTDKPHLLWNAYGTRLSESSRWDINTTYTRHHHANWMLRHLNGEKVQYCTFPNIDEWRECSDDLLSHSWDLSYQFRIKPKTININGFEIPQPLREEPKDGDYYWVALMSDRVKFNNDDFDKTFLAAGMCHSTKEAAEIHWNAIKSFTEEK